MVRLEPGESRLYTFTFNDPSQARDLRSGEHEARVVYYSSKLLDGVKEDLSSNTVKFTVKD